ncbi:MAG: YceI family protein, partial [Thermomicrobiaceae bacterium]|nr:YceI family protein [Thermomicrobiaceae bacterium]
VKRSQFGLTWNRPVAGTGPMIGDTVRITLDIQAVKQG